ncbi:hypothetical protein [Priestia megaterium]|uniref:hypothetical protein n=1 Tax=Priestia megaterium TaxID=1404 RepID=UPI000BFE3256|nr:hypothetical protein [Priestia megaterium]PGO60670.1 hypothetical protein CN981_08965 [Priestia megaterium]
MSIITNVKRTNWIEVTENNFIEGEKINFDVIQVQAFIMQNCIILGFKKHSVTINRSKTNFKEVLKVV